MYFEATWQVHVITIWKILSGLEHIFVEIYEVTVGLISLYADYMASRICDYLSLMSVLSTTQSIIVIPFVIHFLATPFDI